MSAAVGGLYGRGSPDPTAPERVGTLDRSAQVAEAGVMTLYDRVGGAPVVHALADAWHRRVLADPVVEHAFSHGFNADHVARLAAYWAQAWGGPDTFTTSMGDEAAVVAIHSHMGVHADMDQRAERCFVDATREFDLPDKVRGELLDFWRWAASHMNAYPFEADVLPSGIPFATWPGRA